MLVHHRQDLQRPAVDGLVVHEVVRPHMIDMRGRVPRDPALDRAQTHVFIDFLRHLQPVPTPQTMYPILSRSPHLEPLLLKHHAHPPVPIPQYCFRQCDSVAGLTSNFWHTCPAAYPEAFNASASRSLGMISQIGVASASSRTPWAT